MFRTPSTGLVICPKMNDSREENFKPFQGLPQSAASAFVTFSVGVSVSGPCVKLVSGVEG